MGIFTGLLTILKRDFEVTEEDFQNGYVRRNYSDGLDKYQVDVFKGQEKAIYAPNKRCYTRSGAVKFDEES